MQPPRSILRVDSPPPPVFQVRAAREFPEDLVRLSIGIVSAEDLIADLSRAMQSYTAPGPAAAAKAAASAAATTK